MDKHLPTPGDIHLQVTVQSQGFSGKGKVWVEEKASKSFIAQLSQLAASRQGSAELKSISPGELHLNISITDSIGHTEIQQISGQ